MPSAALLRKTMLAILQNHILPDLQNNGARRLVTARLPLRLPEEITVKEMPPPPLLDADAKKRYPGGKEWKMARMHALRYPSLYCVVEGEADLAMGVTASMLSGAGHKSTFKKQPGGYIFSLRAPAYFLVPPNIPQRTIPPWQREEPHRGNLHLFVIRVLPVGALCTTAEMANGDYSVGYSLLVKDDQLAAVAGILVNELSGSPVDPQISLAQLMTLMLRLKRGLDREIPLMTDGLYSRFPDNDSPESPMPLLHHPLIERAHQYIQLHLHELLTPAAIAAHVQVTPDHLARVLKARTGFTTMHYVTSLRMEAAQLLLQSSDLSVREIGRLVGFYDLSHFSRTFHRHNGATPLRYRQQRKSSPADVKKE
jgi:AraC-like DNA-binding protein